MIVSPCAQPAAAPLPIVIDSPSAAAELWHRYHNGADASCENALVREYLPVVRSVLGRLAMSLPEHVDRDDLQSAGLMGLLHALRNFDPGCRTSFQTYARLRIRGAMLDELRRMDWIPRSVHEKARKIQQTMAFLEQKLGRAPSESEIARTLKLSVGEYAELLNEIRPATFVCLDSVFPSENGEASSLCEVLADPEEAGPMEAASTNELKQLVLRRITELPLNQRRVLALYYGEDLHLREIAEVLGVTESRICQIHSQAILSIRAYLQRLEAGSSRKTHAT
jgi:RNA polymerase sigma factor for flagellar operon FliA